MKTLHKRRWVCEREVCGQARGVGRAVWGFRSCVVRRFGITYLAVLRLLATVPPAVRSLSVSRDGRGLDSGLGTGSDVMSSKRCWRMGMGGGSLVQAKLIGTTARIGFVLITAIAMLAVVLPITPAAAVTVRTVSSDRVLGDLRVDRLDIRANNRVIRGNVLKLPAGASNLELRPSLARGTAVGLETMPSLSATQLRRGAVAGINGGYFVDRPTGVPNGLYVERGRMVAGDSSMRQSALPLGRAVAGFTPDGTLVADRLQVTLSLDVPAAGLSGIAINEINRMPRIAESLTHAISGELILYDTNYGSAFHVPQGAMVLIVDELAVGSSGRVSGVVRERRGPRSQPGNVSVAEGTSVLLAYGSAVPRVAEINVGDEIGVTTTIGPSARFPTTGFRIDDWNQVRSAIPGAGLLIRDGRISSGTSMGQEGVNHHGTARARTAVGQRSDGTTLLLTLDETAGSQGATLFQLAQIMAELGAQNAVAMDGGGSTHMTINGRTHNSPSHSGRGQSSAWFVYAPRPEAPRAMEQACPASSVPAAPFTDHGHSVHAEAIACLAWWQITGGVTDTQFVPGRDISRDQMASMLARWIDEVAARGDGRALPRSAPLPFVDVDPNNVHADAIARLSNVEVIRGRSATSFDPAANVTRAETATLLRRAIDYVTTSALPTGRDVFVDDNHSAHESSIDQLAAIQVVGGTGGFSYRPGDAVSRAAMASMVMRASDYVVAEGLTTPPR